jgi:hypothetical protein
MPEAVRLEMPAGIIERHAQHLRIGDQFGDGGLRHHIAFLALHLGDELRETDEQLGGFHRRDHPARALPKSQRLRELAGQLHFAGQEHALPRHEHVVEHHEAFRHAVMRARGIIERVEFRGRKAAVDDADAFGGDGNGERHGIIRLVLAHALGRHHHQFVNHDAAVMCSLAPRTTMPSLRRSTMRT